MVHFACNKYSHNEYIDFLGQLTWEELSPIVAHAKFMVLPSECSENNPLTVIESQSLGTPVLGARIGGIPELIEEGKTGMTFEKIRFKRCGLLHGIIMQLPCRRKSVIVLRHIIRN